MKVIYFEDDPASTMVMKQMLLTAGAKMEGASSAQRGFALLAQQRFDLVLMDLRMPEMNGLTALRQLRAREGGDTRLPVVIVSAELTAGTRELCQGAGADAFIEKPIVMEKLFHIVGAAMAGAANSQFL